MHTHRVETLFEGDVVEIRGEARGRLGTIDRDGFAIRATAKGDEDQAGTAGISAPKKTCEASRKAGF